MHIGPSAFLGIACSATRSLVGSGATIVGMVSGGPAANAGLLVGDTIVTFDGRAITSPTALTQHMLVERVGDSVRVSIVGAGSQQKTTVVLGSGPPQ